MLSKMVVSAFSKFDRGDLSAPLPGEAILIIGSGHFGRRAARILREKPDTPIFVVDRNETSFAEIEDLAIETFLCDGIDFLVKNFHLLSASNTIIPAVPVNLAYEWLKGYLSDLRIKQTKVPEEISPLLPHTWPGTEGSLLISYADFKCPDDCPEPEGYCTVTGESREVPLYELLRKINPLKYRGHIIRSRQLAPGLGGYKADELGKLAIKVRKKGPGRWLVGTACRCHGIVTALEIYEK